MDVLDVNQIFMAALRCGRLERLSELIDTHGLSDSTPWGNGCFLSLALEGGHVDIAELLLSKGSEVNRKIYGLHPHNTPLHFAAFNGYVKIVEMILNKNARIDAKNNDGNTPLHFAAFNGHVKIVEIILNKNARIDAKNNDGNTPLHYAAINGDIKILEMILNNASRNNGMRAPLYFASESLYKKETVTMLLAKGANINATSEDGLTPLHIAAETGSQELVTLLLLKGADFNIRMKDGRTPLHLSVQHSCGHGIMETLLESGADIDSRDGNGRTAFYFALENRNVKNVETLLEHRCNIDDVNCTNEVYIFSTRPTDEDIHFWDETLVARLFQQLPKFFMCAELFLQHIIKMLAANLYVSEQHFKLRDYIVNNIMSDFHIKCQEEIANMKKKINNANISFYDLLANNTSSLAIYVRNEDVMQVLKTDNYKIKFPIYASMIKLNLRKCLERKEILEQTNIIFHFFNNFAKLPYECTEKIFTYLSNNDIRILIDAFKPGKR